MLSGTNLRCLSLALRTRRVTSALAVSLVPLAFFALLVPASFVSPQLRGPAPATFSLIAWSLIAGLFLAGVLTSQCWLEEFRGVRSVAVLNVTSLLIGLATLLVEALALLALTGTAAATGSVVRNVLVVGGISATLGHLHRPSTAITTVMAYCGVCFFGGVNAQGDVEWWARLLSDAAGPVDAVTAAAAMVVAVLVALTFTGSQPVRDED